MRSRIRTFIAMTATAVVVAGCGSSSDTPADAGSDNTGASNSTAATAREVTIAIPTMPSGADMSTPNSADSTSVGMMARSYSGTLYGFNGADFDPNTQEQFPEPLPELAAETTVSEDGLTVTIVLRSEAKSQYGNTLSAGDVIWSIDRVIATEGTSLNSLRLINLDLDDPVTAVDEATVEFHLTAPTVLFEKVLSTPGLGVFDSKAVAENAGDGDEWGVEWLKTNSASYGPYFVASSDLPNRITLEANPNYWRGPGNVGKATFIGIAEESTRLQSLLTGQISYAAQLSATSVSEVESSSQANPYFLTTSPVFVFAQFMLDSPKVADPTLRRAISLAIDRKAAVDSALGGHGSAVTSCLPTIYGTEPTDLDTTETGDLDAAKELIAKVGDVEPLTIGYTNSFPGGGVIPQAVQESLAKIGVTAALKPYTAYATFLADMGEAKVDIGLNGFGPQVVDAGFALNMYTEGSATNYGRYSNPEYDAAVLSATSSRDEAGTTAIATACEILMTDVPGAPIARIDGLAGTGTDVAEIAGVGEHVLVYKIKLK